jgi:hypothetical protein
VAGAAISFSPTNLAFGTQKVETISNVQTTTLTNTGTTPLNVTNIQQSTNPAVFGQVNNCGGGASNSTNFSLAAGNSCTLSVIFAPHTIGLQTGVMTITSNATAATNGVQLGLTGTGTLNPPVCSLTAKPSRIQTGRSSTLTATCSSTGIAYSWTGGTCAGTTVSTCSVSPTVTTTYGVTGTNSYGSSSAAATVTVKDVDLTPILMLLLD